MMTRSIKQQLIESHYYNSKFGRAGVRVVENRQQAQARWKNTTHVFKDLQNKKNVFPNISKVLTQKAIGNLIQRNLINFHIFP